MRAIIVSVILLVASTFSQAQDFRKGGNYVSAGFGIDPLNRTSNLLYTGTGYKRVSVGPIMLMYERGITDVLGIGRIGVGGDVGLSFHKEEYYTSTFLGGTVLIKDHWAEIQLRLRGAYHFEFDIPKMDLYAGVAAGVAFDIGNSGSHFSHHEFVGIRYYFSESFGVYAEVGYSPLVSGGVVFSF